MIWALAIVPVLAGLALYLLPRSAPNAAKWIGVGVSFVAFAAVLGLRGAPDESVPWFRYPFVANFHVGLGSGISFWIAALLALVSGCALAVVRVPRQRDFVAQMVILLGAMMGVFIARDLLVFALFWDLQLIPVFLILIGWSPERHGRSAWRYLIYNLAGGLALLLAAAAFGIAAQSTDVIGLPSPAGTSWIENAGWGGWIFAGIALAFLVKTPVWPLHTWMPETYADLPPPAAALVSAVQSKGGLYGFIAIAAPLLPGPVHAAAPWLIGLGAIGLLYGAFVALVEDDAKRVVAYSSLSHLGLILIAIFSFDPVALAGAIVYLIAHGLFSAGLFLVLGEVESREDTRLISRLGGLGARNPRLAGALVILSLAALGLPGLAGFAGEILIVTGVYRAGFLWPSLFALVAIVLAAAYMLRLFQGVMQGPEVADLPQRPDMTGAEMLALAPLVLAIVLLGVNPGPVAAAAREMLAPPAPVVSVRPREPVATSRELAAIASINPTSVRR
jgi:NADH-quinone oxidoreductase subunit M